MISNVRKRESRENKADIKAARAALREGGTPIPWEKVKTELGLRGQKQMRPSGKLRRAVKSNA